MLQALQYTKQNYPKTVFPQSAWVVPYMYIKDFKDKKQNKRHCNTQYVFMWYFDDEDSMTDQHWDTRAGLGTEYTVSFEIKMLCEATDPMLCTGSWVKDHQQ